MDLANVGRVLYSTPTFLGTKKVNADTPITGLPIEEKTAGSFTITHIINQGSEIRIAYTTVPSYKISLLRSSFVEGSIHTYDSVQYIVTNYGETIDTQKLGKYGSVTAYTVDVSLVTYSYLKASVSTKLSFPANGTSFISVQTIAAKASVGYQGFDFAIPVTKDTTNTYYNFSLAEEVNKRAYEFQKVIDYNNTVTTRTIGFGSPVIGQISPIQVSGSPPIQYKDAVVSWVNNNLDPFRNDTQYMRPQPVRVVLAEGDLDVQIVPQSLSTFYDQTGRQISSASLSDPVDGNNTSGTWFEATKALYMTFDNGGITKQLRLTQKEDGATISVQSWRYGFIFTAYNLAQNGGSPQQYWRCIEYTRTNYFYDFVSSDFSEIKYQDRSGVWRTTIVDPKTKQLLQQNRVGYLTRTETTGYKYARFAQEQQGGWNIEKDQSIPGSIFWGRRLYSGISLRTGSDSSERNFVERMLNLYLFRKIPIYGTTQYDLAATNSLYNERYGGVSKAIQASIEKVPWASLPDNLRNSARPDSEGFIGIVRPDPDSYQEYLVLGERSESINIAWQTNPLAIQYSGNQTIGDKEPVIPNDALPKTYYPAAKPYIIGESTTSSVSRQIVPTRSTTSGVASTNASDLYRYGLPPEASVSYSGIPTASTDPIEKYVEYTDNSNAQGIDLAQKAGLTTFSELEGRPPSASIKRTGVVQKEVQNDPFFRLDTEYYYTSLLNASFPTDEGTGSFQLLEIKQGDLTGTQKAIDFRVSLENALNTKELTVDLGYYRPEYKVGYKHTVIGIEGIWLTKRVEHSFDFSGAFLSAKPTKITMGKWYDIKSQITTSQFPKQSPTDLPYNPSRYNVLGSRQLQRQSNTPSLIGDRGGEQPIISQAGSP